MQCDRCEYACLADVEWQENKQGHHRPYMHCEDPFGWGKIPLEQADVQLWRTSFSHLADVAASLFGFQMPREEVITDRLWWLGGKNIAQRDVDFFLARGAYWDDAFHLFSRNGRLKECANPFVLVPYEVNGPSPFPSKAPVRSLASLLQFDDHQLHLRQEQVAETVRQIGAERQQTMIPIPTPPGTTWSQVLIEFANDDYVQISVGKERQYRSFAEMGFADLRKPVPTPSELWEHFRTLAKYEGRIGWDTAHAVADKDRNKVRKWISAIRQKLRAIFPDIADDPFESYHRARAYQLKCILRSTTEK